MVCGTLTRPISRTTPLPPAVASTMRARATGTCIFGSFGGAVVPGGYLAAACGRPGGPASRLPPCMLREPPPPPPARALGPCRLPFMVLTSSLPSPPPTHRPPPLPCCSGTANKGMGNVGTKNSGNGNQGTKNVGNGNRSVAAGLYSRPAAALLPPRPSAAAAAAPGPSTVALLQPCCCHLASLPPP